jgi:hypothetical protein
LGVEKVKRAKIGWARGRFGRTKDGEHARGQDGRDGRGRRRTGKENAELVGGKENMAIGAVVGEEVGAGGRAQSSKVGGWESFEVCSSDNRSSRRRGARSGEKSTIGSRSGGRSEGKARRRG